MHRTNFSILAFFFISILVSFTACQDNTDDTIARLSHDNANFLAPELPAQLFEAATRFRTDEMAFYVDDQLTEIEFYFQEVPASCELRVYTSNGGNIPTNQVYSSGEIIQTLNSDRWHTHVLTTPLVLDGSDLWISVRYLQNTSQRTLGCDAGPAKIDGDWLFDPFDGLWQPLIQRTGGGIDINWNIRGVVELQ